MSTAASKFLTVPSPLPWLPEAVPGELDEQLLSTWPNSAVALLCTPTRVLMKPKDLARYISDKHSKQAIVTQGSLCDEGTPERSG